jgi:hypothetical protein
LNSIHFFILGKILLARRAHGVHGLMKCPWSDCLDKFNDLDDLWDHFCDTHTPYDEHKSNMMENGPQSSLQANLGSLASDLDKSHSLTVEATTATDSMDLDFNAQNSSISIENDQQHVDVNMEDMDTSEQQTQNVSAKYSHNNLIFQMKVGFF